MDYADAEKRARDNLGRMVNLQVKSEVISITKDSGTGGGASRFGQVTSEQVSNALLKSSEIFSYWVDVESCTVYAGARVAKADIERAIREVEAAERRRLVNQRWKLIGKGMHTDIITAQLGQKLSALGVTLRDSSSATDFVMSGNVSDVSMHNSNKVVRITLRLEARNANGALIWNRLIQGKGITLSSETEATLVKKAVQDALENAGEDLTQFMQGSVKP